MVRIILKRSTARTAWGTSAGITIISPALTVCVSPPMVISATHDPVPLLNQLAQRYGDAYTTEYGERGPERWRILIRRAA